MLKKLGISGIALMMIFLAACSSQGAAGASETAGAGQISSDTLNADYENALSVEMQLVIGTIKLEGTEHEISAATAAELLPLWKAIRSLSSSDAAAAEEIQAVFRQIEDTMTPERRAAVNP